MIKAFRSLFLLFCFVVAHGLAAQENDQATLIADEVVIDEAGNLIATGNIEIFYKDETLTAEAVTYDATEDRVAITGPLIFVDKDKKILNAESADLTRDLKTGLIYSARMMLKTQLELRAETAKRIYEHASTLGRSFFERWVFEYGTTNSISEIIGCGEHLNFKYNAARAQFRVVAEEQHSKLVIQNSNDTSLIIEANWKFKNNLRYDLIADPLAAAGFGVEYDAQCVNVNFGLSRRYTETGTSPPQTNFELTISLKGFSTGGASRAV
jgi:lipopolysaccharide assembly outer membrane protein LptD (OstA)